LIVGASASTTVTLNEHDADCPSVSTTVYVSTCRPTLNGTPHPSAAAGLTVDATQSTVVGALYVTRALHRPTPLFTSTSAGHVICGALLSSTVTVKLQLAVLPDASVAVYSTIVVPSPNAVPGRCPRVTFVVTLHASVPTGSVNHTTAVQLGTSRPTVMLAGHEITGGVRSSTATVNWHVPVFACASVAVNVTPVDPTANMLPDGVPPVCATVAMQLSCGVAANITVAPHCPTSVACVMSPGHVTVGGSISTTVTVNVHWPMLLLPSVAEYVTVVGPKPNVTPLGGDSVPAMLPSQLSNAPAVYVTTAEHIPRSVACGKLPGHVTDGAWASFTTTSNMHGEAALPDVSTALQLVATVPLFTVESF